MSRLALPRRRATSPVGVPVDAAAARAPSTDDGSVGEERRAAALQATWTGGSALAARATTVLVCGALTAGPLALGWSLFGGSPVLPPATSSAADPSLPPRTLAGETAQAWLTAWLTTPAERSEELAVFWDGDLELPDVPASVAATSVAYVQDVGEGLWSVTVAAEVTQPGPPATEQVPTPVPLPPVRRYFTVPVVVDPAGGQGPATVAVAGPPAPVPSPPRAQGLRLPYNESLPMTAPVADTAAQFVTALVTGAGDISRYTSPGSTITAITPPAAAAVEVRRVLTDSDDSAAALKDAPEAGAEVQVLVQVDLVDAAGRALGSSYPLTLRARDGRWEVAQLDPAPALDPARPDLAAADPPPSGPPSAVPTPTDPATTPTAPTP